MRRGQSSPFLLVVVDEEKKEFTVEGPMVDDTNWNNGVYHAQKAGRRVRCFTPSGDRQSVIRYEERQGYRFVPEGSILSPSFD